MRLMKPGVFVQRSRYVVANLPVGVLLSDATIHADTENLHIEDMRLPQFPVDSAVYKILYENYCVAPKIEDVKVGDGLLIFKDSQVRFVVVAVIDRTSLFVYDTDGEIIPMDDPSVSRCGWHDIEYDLLSARGKLVLSMLYP